MCAFHKRVVFKVTGETLLGCSILIYMFYTLQGNNVFNFIISYRKIDQKICFISVKIKRLRKILMMCNIIFCDLWKCRIMGVHFPLTKFDQAISINNTNLLFYVHECLVYFYFCQRNEKKTTNYLHYTCSPSVLLEL